MLSFKEHIAEGADRNGAPKKYNKNLYAKMVIHARHHIQGVADDIEQGVQDVARMMGKHNAGSVYHGVEDHLADHLHDTFRNHPGYGDGGVSLARHVSKKITAEYIHDDRPEYRAAVRNHEAKQKRAEAAKNRPPKAPKQPRQKASEPAKPVWVHTSGGMKLRTMKLPPFRKESVNVRRAGPAKLVSYGPKGDSMTAVDVAHHLRKRAGEYTGGNTQLIHKLADEVEKHGSTSANDLIKKHRSIGHTVGMIPSAAHNFITSTVFNNK